ncbi:exported protein of unknown function [Streptantibioticus cattleyicolor NRRL 8057 = DSM 46488]|nr:exported protein of unknown function [Streptantibioticus cattleyicolor NRRL 8057 = DSM 46488]
MPPCRPARNTGTSISTRSSRTSWRRARTPVRRPRPSCLGGTAADLSPPAGDAAATDFVAAAFRVRAITGADRGGAR